LRAAQKIFFSSKTVQSKTIFVFCTLPILYAVISRCEYTQPQPQATKISQPPPPPKPNPPKKEKNAHAPYCRNKKKK